MDDLLRMLDTPLLDYAAKSQEKIPAGWKDRAIKMRDEGIEPNLICVMLYISIQQYRAWVNPRPEYTQEYKDKVIAERHGGATYKDLNRKYGLSPSTIARWSN